MKFSKNERLAPTWERDLPPLCHTWLEDIIPNMRGEHTCIGLMTSHFPHHFTQRAMAGKSQTPHSHFTKL